MALSSSGSGERAAGHSWTIQPSNIPIPDPSVVTANEIAKIKTELRHEFTLAITGLGETLAAARNGYIATLNARLDGMDKTSAIRDENLKSVPSALDREAARLERLLEEKVANINSHFDNVSTRFNEREVRYNQDKAAVADAIAAALLAQKDAARAHNESIAATFAKSETSFTKEIDSLKALITATRDTIAANVVNLTGRLDRGEAGQQGARRQTEDVRANTAMVTAIVAGVVGFLALVVTIFGIWAASSRPSGALSRGEQGAIVVAPINPSSFSAPRQ